MATTKDTASAIRLELHRLRAKHQICVRQEFGRIYAIDQTQHTGRRLAAEQSLRRLQAIEAPAEIDDIRTALGDSEAVAVG